MSSIKVKAFGITKDFLGGKEIILELREGKTVGHLREVLNSKYPKLSGIRSLFIAVNNEYAEEQTELSETDEIALIPPVSGG